MKALVYRGPFDVNVEDLPDARVQDPTDAVVRMTTPWAGSGPDQGR